MVSFSRQHLMKILSIIVLGCVLYANSIEVPFHFDDLPNITEDETVRLTRLLPANLYHAAFTGVSGDRPLAKLSFALNYYLDGYDVVGFHLVNIAMHVATAVLLYLFLFLTFQTPALKGQCGRDASIVALLGAILWMVHPVQIQGVTYIVQRMTSMATMFYLLAFLCYIKSRMVQSRKSGWGYLFAGLIVWGFSLASKPIGVILPFFVILYEWFFFQSLNRQWFLRKIPWFAMAAFVLLAFVFVYLGETPVETLLSGYGGRPFSLGERLLTELRVVVFYLSLLVLPLPGRLNLEHDFALSHSLMDPVATCFSLLLLLALLGAALLLCKKHRFLSFAILWFLGSLVLESTFIALELVFEHRLYLSSMMILAFLPYGLVVICRQKKLAIYMISLAIVFLSFVTYNRNLLWQDVETLALDCVAKSPGKPRALSNLANYFLLEDDLAGAEPLLARAIARNPRYVQAIYNMGTVMQKTGRSGQALYYYQKVNALDNDHIGSLNNSGMLYAQLGELQKAMRCFVEILRLEPDHEVALTNLGMVLEDMGRLDEAIVKYKRALVVTPTSLEAKALLTQALQKKIQ